MDLKFGRAFNLVHILIVLITVVCTCNLTVHATSPKHHGKFHQFNEYGISKLFVFGDSYADTGNLHLMFKKQPYGTSFPGKPGGRYSDGLLLTDYIAKFLGFKSPAPYHWRKYEKRRLHYGMNFAYGGAGVFKTLYPRPNISAQIDLFENLLNDGVYTKYDLESSLVLVTLAGNDYDAYLENGGNPIALVGSFTLEVTHGLALSLDRLSKLGAKRIAVGGLQAMECLPYITEPDYKECNDTGTGLAIIHNDYLGQELDTLNAKRLGTNFTLLALDLIMEKILGDKQDSTGKLKFPDPLRPCCMGTTPDSNCGDVGPNGEKLYKVCEDPKSAFFWDSVHPTQAGWEAVYNSLKSTLDDICSFI